MKKGMWFLGIVCCCKEFCALWVRSSSFTCLFYQTVTIALLHHTTYLFFNQSCICFSPAGCTMFISMYWYEGMKTAIGHALFFECSQSVLEPLLKHVPKKKKGKCIASEQSGELFFRLYGTITAQAQCKQCGLLFLNHWTDTLSVKCVLLPAAPFIWSQRIPNLFFLMLICYLGVITIPQSTFKWASVNFGK